MGRPKVAIIIPVYNPPLRWEVSCYEHILALKTLNPNLQFHFVIVNDGSSEKKFSYLDTFLKRMKISHSQCKHPQNYGKGKALRTGVKHIKHWADYFICVDWDFPFGSAVISDMVTSLQKGADVVVADRTKDYGFNIPFMRSLVTKVWRLLVVKHLQLGVSDTQAGVKGFRRSAVPAFLNSQINTFLHDLEFLLNCGDRSLKLESLPVYLRGGIKLSYFSPNVYLRELGMFFDLLLRRWKKNHLAATETKQAKKLILNADDFGMTKAINAGIKKAILAKKINSVSVVVTGKYFTDAVSFLKKHPKIRVGLHFALTETPEHPGLLSVILAAVAGKLTIPQVTQALESQFAKLQQTGLKISHLDSHQHIHIYPPFFGLLCEFAQKHQIARVRNCRFSFSQFLLALKLRPTLKQLIIWLFYGMNEFFLPNQQRTAQLATTCMYDLNWQNRLSQPELSVLHQHLPAGISEIICHLSISVNQHPLSRNRHNCLHLLLKSDIPTII